MPVFVLTNKTLRTVFLLIVNSSFFVIINLYNMSSMEKLLSANFKVFGRVQGVFFRKYTKSIADRLGIRGWVQNEKDGTVIGVIQGKEPQMLEMRTWISHKGSPVSRIDKCEFSNERTIDQLEYAGFTINRG